MEQKNKFEQYLKNMYEFYQKSNFAEFVNKILNYNIEIGRYKNNIADMSKKVFYSVLELKASIDNIKYNEYNNYYYIESINENSNIINEILLDIPLFINDYEQITVLLVKYMYGENINFTLKINKIYKNSLIQIKVFNSNDALKVIDYFENNSEIKNTTKSRVVPFLYQISLIGIYSEIKPYSFKNEFIVNLYSYYSKISDSNDVSLESFYRYIENIYKSEAKINKKRMLYFLYMYIDTIYNEKNIFDIFNVNTIMNLSSFSSNDYNLKLDENNMIYFVDKIDNDIQIKYGSEDFLNVAYSKYYDNYIRQEKNDKFYASFYNIYSEIISNNYSNVENILTLLNDKMDHITKLLTLISSAFFASKKMNFSIKQSYKILDYLLKIMDSYNVEKKENKISILYELSEEYGNKEVVDRKGTQIKIKDYFEKNNIINNIPANCIVNMKRGIKVSGKEFLDAIYDYIRLYNSYSELMDDLVDTIEF